VALQLGRWAWCYTTPHPRNLKCYETFQKTSTLGETGGVIQVFGWETDHLEHLGIDGKIFKKWDDGEWTAMIWLRVVAGGWLL